MKEFTQDYEIEYQEKSGNYFIQMILKERGSVRAARLNPSKLEGEIIYKYGSPGKIAGADDFESKLEFLKNAYSLKSSHTKKIINELNDAKAKYTAYKEVTGCDFEATEGYIEPELASPEFIKENNFIKLELDKNPYIREISCKKGALQIITNHIKPDCNAYHNRYFTIRNINTINAILDSLSTNLDTERTKSANKNITLTEVFHKNSFRVEVRTDTPNPDYDYLCEVLDAINEKPKEIPNRSAPLVSRESCRKILEVFHGLNYRLPETSACIKVSNSISRL